MKNLDFLIIGAQKCATTTLFEHLRKHPDIHMPLEKEVPFFTGEACDEAAWERFAAQKLGAADGRLWGKATPQYMCDPRVPERIRALMPQVKLVAILRDPIERTLSHYLMGKRRNTETQSFDEVVETSLDPGVLQRNRLLPVPEHTQGYESESDFYIAWSEYGRILQRYRELFGRDQLLVLYTEELERDPQGTLDGLLAFIGLEPGFRPESLGQVMHRGGGSNRIPHGVRTWLRDRRSLYALWQLVPAERQGRLRFLYERWNAREEAPRGGEMSAATREALRRHFQPDLDLLAALSPEAPPWIGQYRAA